MFADESLSIKLGFDYDPLQEDWELVNADPARLSEFIDFYCTAPLEGYERTLMFELIFASYSEMLESGEFTLEDHRIEDFEKRIQDIYLTNSSEFRNSLELCWTNPCAVESGYKATRLANKLLELGVQ